jgi:hypothetical protein
VASRFAVESVIRDSKQSEQISSLGAKPVVLSLEDGNVQVRQVQDRACSS